MTRPRTALLALAVLAILACGWIVWVRQSPEPYGRYPVWLQKRPSIYFQIALSRIRAHAFGTSTADWTAIDAHATDMASEATTDAETYPAIRDVLDQLSDHHSLLVPAAAAPHSGAPTSYGLQVVFPERIVALVYPGSPAAAAGIHPGDRIQFVEGHPPMVSHDVHARGHFIDIPPPETTLTLRLPDGRMRDVPLSVGPYQLLPADTHRIGTDLGYVELPGTSGQNGFADRVRDGIASADAPTVCGWIVDLRRDIGGALPPMLQAIRPILGEPPLGFFVDRDGQQTPWQYPASGEFAIARAPTPLAHPNPPVAVLTSRLTANAGEAVAIAFRGRSATRSFGEATWGVPAASSARALPDGAVLELTTALDADRTGHVYDGRLPPDEVIAVDWAQVGSPTDPLIVASATWLRAQPGCHH